MHAFVVVVCFVFCFVVVVGLGFFLGGLFAFRLSVFYSLFSFTLFFFSKSAEYSLDQNSQQQQ